MKRLKIAFFPTDEECESDQRRQMEEAYIQDWMFGRIRPTVALTDDEIKNGEDIFDYLIDKQDNQVWVIGWGYLNRSEATIPKRIHGLLKSLRNLKIYFYDVEIEQIEELIPF